jgi:hypothetical protein
MTVHLILAMVLGLAGTAARASSGGPLRQRPPPEVIPQREHGQEHGQSGHLRRCISRLNGRKFLIPLSEGWPSQAEGSGLENRQGASPREFESPPLRYQFTKHIRYLS